MLWCSGTESQPTLIRGLKKTCHLQLRSTFQRQAFSSNPKIQQSITVNSLALFWAMATLNIGNGLVPLLTQHTKCLIRPDSIQALIRKTKEGRGCLQEANKTSTLQSSVCCVLTQGEAHIYSCSREKLTVNNYVVFYTQISPRCTVNISVFRPL